MGLDIPILLSSIYLFISLNAYGWGILHDKRFVFSLGFITILYLLLNVSIFAKKILLQQKLKMVLVFTLIVVAVFTTTVNFMYLRNREFVASYVNDSALQTEIAGRFLLLKKNPYSESFVKTDLAKWRYEDEVGNKRNPALYQNVIPPFMIVTSAIGFRIFSQVFGWFDIRIITLFAYLFVMLFGIIRFNFKEKLLFFLILVGLNPLFISNIIQGSNDIVVLAFILWSLFFLEKKNFIISGVILGLAIATKQTAWFALPFFLFYSWKQNFKYFLRFIAPLTVVSLVFYLPFIFWNSQAILNSLVVYVNSSVSRFPIHPIEGFGFGGLLLSLGVLNSIYAKFPFALFQLFIGLIIIFILLYSQRKKINVSDVIYSYAILTLIVWFFNRYFLESHIAYIMVLIGVSYVLSMNDAEKAKI
ncbi:DUF2029 domain-containing protein [Candidatus Microgenomates bacterium]|nr:MAG: DUF2029 domain-containing protein [Candidatus Microgenomates bacterium]